MILKGGDLINKEQTPREKADEALHCIFLCKGKIVKIPGRLYNSTGTIVIVQLCCK